ncbi:Mut7-C RNAse domain-containing protein [Halomicroarcula sp. F13]|uniref:Mut7-C RNAse domain-containing protein n=1 Tax=Haloarcula rubra TaxID=2487747 RepID=A0AAW4PMR2_9EURY|nr:Mut7-C RNAse domain-containing protein [Halomicroarcula rubra]MBX0321687.1 Mut7-C RNAse domain-containing protein [Halomicroarcula rubra]
MSETDRRDPLLLDAMLGKLASYLRMCGYDAAYALDRGAESDADVLALARTEGRRLVTRDEGLAREMDDALLLTRRDVEEQLRELSGVGFELDLSDEPVHCGTCNAPVERVDRTEPTPDYAPDPAEEPVWRCRDCGQHFWRGSHWDDVADTLAEL